jgi:hypothetical protein
LATVTDRSVSFDELMRDPEADDGPATEAKSKGKKAKKAASAAKKKAEGPPEG